MRTDPYRRGKHLSLEFAVWCKESAWFWSFIHPSGEGATIGASANEAQALRDVWHSIEEKLSQL